jgi:hypothetical protein
MQFGLLYKEQHNVQPQKKVPAWQGCSCSVSHADNPLSSIALGPATQTLMYSLQLSGQIWDHIGCPDKHTMTVSVPY